MSSTDWTGPGSGTGRIVGSLEAIRGNVAHGWAASDHASRDPLEIVFMMDGRAVGATRPGFNRPDVAGMGLSALAGYKCRLEIHPHRDADRLVTAHLLGRPDVPLGSAIVMPLEVERAWLARSPDTAAIPPPTLAGALGIVLIVEPHDSGDAVAATVASLLAQTDPSWGLAVAGADQQRAERIALDPRITVLRWAEPFATRLRSALQAVAATSQAALLLRAGAMLERDAVALFRALVAPEAAITYTDDALIGQDRDDLEGIRLKPAFSPDLHAATPLFGACFLVRLPDALDVWRFRPGVPVGDLHEFGLALTEISAAVAHLPSILVRLPRALAYGEARPEAVAAHLRRIGRRAVVSRHAGGAMSVTPEQVDGKVLAVIPTRNNGGLLRACIDSVVRSAGDAVEFVVVDHASDDPETRDTLEALRARATVIPYAGPFNFAAMNNLAVAAAARPDHRFVLFLNNDIEAIGQDWFDRMKAYAARPDIGVVGATLIYGSGTIQHTGVVLGLYGIADHAHKGFIYPGHHDGAALLYHGLGATRPCSVVTGACMMMRSALFLDIGGFDESFPIDYNDVDLCLRVQSLGLTNLVTGSCALYHHESVTRGTTSHPSLPRAIERLRARWGAVLGARDPFYHPKLSIEHDHAIDRLDGIDPLRIRHPWRTIAPAARARPEAVDRAREASRLPGEARPPT